MKKLTENEFSDLLLTGKGKSSPFYKAIIGLHIGEILFISQKEWNGCRTPTRICRYIMKKFPHVEYVFGKVADGSLPADQAGGWGIKRVK